MGTGAGGERERGGCHVEVKRTLSCSNSCQQQFPDQHQMDVMLPLAQGRTSAAPSHDSGGASAINQRLYGGSCDRRTAKNKIYTKAASQAAGDLRFLSVFGSNLSATITALRPGRGSWFCTRATGPPPPPATPTPTTKGSLVIQEKTESQLTALFVAAAVW